MEKVNSIEQLPNIPNIVQQVLEDRGLCNLQNL